MKNFLRVRNILPRITKQGLKILYSRIWCHRNCEFWLHWVQHQRKMLFSKLECGSIFFKNCQKSSFRQIWLGPLPTTRYRRKGNKDALIYVNGNYKVSIRGRHSTTTSISTDHFQQYKIAAHLCSQNELAKKVALTVKIRVEKTWFFSQIILHAWDIFDHNWREPRQKKHNINSNAKTSSILVYVEWKWTQRGRMMLCDPKKLNYSEKKGGNTLFQANCLHLKINIVKEFVWHGHKSFSSPGFPSLFRWHPSFRCPKLSDLNWHHGSSNLAWSSSSAAIPRKLRCQRPRKSLIR